MDSMRKLLIIRLAGVKYGFWNDEIQSVTNDLIIYSLPYRNANPCLAGIVLLEERFFSIVDLSFFIGYSQVNKKNRSIFLLPRQGEVAGFVISGGFEEAEIPPESIYPLPKSIRSEVFTTCVVHKSELIPLINISTLHKLVQNADFEPVTHQVRFDQVEQKTTAAERRIRLVECGGETFAIRASDIEDFAIQPDHTAAFGRRQKYVDGLIFYENEVFPFIDLSRRIRFSDEGTADSVLIAHIGGQRIGLLIEEDKGELGEKLIIESLPPLVRSGWMGDAIILKNEIIPIVDLSSLLLAQPDGIDETTVFGRYNPDFSNEGIPGVVEVVEFSILDIRHAIPKSEFVDSVDISLIRHIPNILPMVLGVAEYENEVLPVLDLAFCYGEISEINLEWKMILLERDNFRAFVVTDNVFGVRNLQIGLPRDRQIKVPQQFVYGCSTDRQTNSVIPILNIENIVAFYSLETAKVKQEAPKKTHRKIFSRETIVLRERVAVMEPDEEIPAVAKQVGGIDDLERQVVMRPDEDVTAEKLALEEQATEEIPAEPPSTEEWPTEKLDTQTPEKLPSSEIEPEADDLVVEELADEELSAEIATGEPLSDERPADEESAALDEQKSEELAAEMPLAELPESEKKEEDAQLAEELAFEDESTEEMAAESAYEEKQAEEEPLAAEEEQVSTEEPSAEEMAEESPPSEVQADESAAAEELATDEEPAETMAGEIPVSEQPAEDEQTTEEPVAKEFVVTDMAAEPPSTEKEAAEEQLEETSAIEEEPAETMAGEVPVSEQPEEDEEVTEELVADESAVEPPSSEKEMEESQITAEEPADGKTGLEPLSLDKQEEKEEAAEEPEVEELALEEQLTEETAAESLSPEQPEVEEVEAEEMAEEEQSRGILAEEIPPPEEPEADEQASAEGLEEEIGVEEEQEEEDLTAAEYTTEDLTVKKQETDEQPPDELTTEKPDAELSTEKPPAEDLTEDKAALEEPPLEKLTPEKLYAELLSEKPLTEEQKTEEVTEEKEIPEEPPPEKLTAEKLYEELSSEQPSTEDQTEAELVAETPEPPALTEKTDIVEPKKISKVIQAEQELTEPILRPSHGMVIEEKQPEIPDKGRKRNYIFYLAAAIFTIAVIYFLVPSKQSDVDKGGAIKDVGSVAQIEDEDKAEAIEDSSTGAVVEKTDQEAEIEDSKTAAKVGESDRVAEGEDVSTAGEVSSGMGDTKKTVESVELKKPVSPRFGPSPEYESYIVKKGDYLIRITRSYTGDGYDYPKVAKENKIPNADLIFPEQVIKIKVEWIKTR